MQRKHLDHAFLDFDLTLMKYKEIGIQRIEPMSDESFGLWVELSPAIPNGMRRDIVNMIYWIEAIKPWKAK